jgi:soluble lytic murein transglycosylase-like protein
MTTKTLAISAALSVAMLAMPVRTGDRDAAFRIFVDEADGSLSGYPDASHDLRISQVERQLQRRMSGLDPALHEDLARVIIGEAERSRIDPLLVLAVIEIESGFDPLAVSLAGAEGLMQLQPATLQREAGELGMAGSDPRDPVANVRAGVRYLRRCLDSYPAVDVALMAYNAGPNRLYGWIQDGGVPAQVTGYARQVKAIHRRLRQAFEAPARPAVAEARAPRLAQ